MRLDKFLVEMGIGTRSESKRMIKKGRVHVNGESAVEPDLKIDPCSDHVAVDGREIAYAAYEYYMLNKPGGYVSAAGDGSGKTVMDLLTGCLRNDLFPVGRLDKDTEGLLLITNDGALAHRLLSPKKHVDKTYYAMVQGKVGEREITRFAEGLDIGDERLTLPAKLEVVEADDKEGGPALGQPVSHVKVTIHEGRYHQVKRMFQAVGMEVLYLKRLSMGPLELDGRLGAGKYRALTEEELSQILPALHKLSI